MTEGAGLCPYAAKRLLSDGAVTPNHNSGLAERAVRCPYGAKKLPSRGVVAPNHKRLRDLIECACHCLNATARLRFEGVTLDRNFGLAERACR